MLMHNNTRFTLTTYMRHSRSHPPVDVCTDNNEPSLILLLHYEYNFLER